MKNIVFISLFNWEQEDVTLIHDYSLQQTVTAHNTFR